MVCMSGHVKMSSVLKLVMTESHTTTDEAINERNAAKVLQKQLFDAHEPNLLDEDDMHIFGSKPMTDPLDLVCCNTCKKPVKASQYAVHADKCSSGKANTNNFVAEDHSGPAKPPKKGRKIKLSVNGNKKIHIKVKVKPQSEYKDSNNGFKLDNECVTNLHPIDSTSNQRLKTSVDAVAISGYENRFSGLENHFRDVPAPLATKMYYSQSNCQLRLELGQLYRESCVEHLGSFTTPNPSQQNGPVVSRVSSGDNPIPSPGAQRNLITKSEYPVQVPANKSESCLGVPHRLTASRPHSSKEVKVESIETQAPAFKKETSRARSNRPASTNSKNKGSKKAQQPNGQRLHLSID